MFHCGRPARRQDEEITIFQEFIFHRTPAGLRCWNPQPAITVSSETSRGVFEMDMILILAAIAAGASFLILMVMEDWA